MDNWQELRRDSRAFYRILHHKNVELLPSEYWATLSHSSASDPAFTAKKMKTITNLGRYFFGVGLQAVLYPEGAAICKPERFQVKLHLK